MLRIPLSNIPNQTFGVNLGGKECFFELVTRNDVLYANKIYIEDKLVACGVACLNKNNIFDLLNGKISGKLYFYDLDGDENPNYIGFNMRWVLLYEE